MFDPGDGASNCIVPKGDLCRPVAAGTYAIDHKVQVYVPRLVKRPDRLMACDFGLQQDVGDSLGYLAVVRVFAIMPG